ncbi:MAG: hypothetical protein JSV88_15250, partial [Candidatus Aminicenantes bacterium]
MHRYEKLFDRIIKEQPAALFIGGDILPSPYAASQGGYDLPYKDFIRDFLVKELNRVKQTLGNTYPKIFIILGNDDARIEEEKMSEAENQGIWEYCHNRRIQWQDFSIYGYTY